MILELFYVVFVTTFVGIVVLGHVLLFSAIYKCVRDDWVIGRRSKRKPPLPDWSSQVAEKVTAENINAGGLPVFVMLPNLSTADR